MDQGTEFKYVKKRVYGSGKVCFIAQLQRYDAGKRMTNSKSFNCIREAAIAVDRYLINQGKEPVNILIRK